MLVVVAVPVALCDPHEDGAHDEHPHRREPHHAVEWIKDGQKRLRIELAEVARAQCDQPHRVNVQSALPHTSRVTLM